jgi:hypothetical protein
VALDPAEAPSGSVDGRVLEISYSLGIFLSRGTGFLDVALELRRKFGIIAPRQNLLR